MAISYREAERRIKAFCRPQRQWFEGHAQDAVDWARLIGYEDGVRDAIKALRTRPDNQEKP